MVIVIMTQRDLKVQVPRTTKEVIDPVDATKDAEQVETVASKKRSAKADGLPDQSEVDATKIERAVLTKQGWIAPNRPDAAKGLR